MVTLSSWSSKLSNFENDCILLFSQAIMGRNDCIARKPSLKNVAHPVCGSPRKDVANHSAAVPAPRDSKSKSSAIISQFYHLNLRPVTLQLKQAAIIISILTRAAQARS